MSSLELTKLLQLMVQHDASDLYLTVESPPMYRINGVLRPAGDHKLTPKETEALAISLLDEKQQAEFNSSREANLAINPPDIGRFRVNVFKQRDFVGLVIRYVRSKILSVDSLELPPILKDIALNRGGLVLVVGATGSGKSTTLAALIDHRNSNSAGHIICIEDPIEYVHPHKRSIVTQREIGIDTHDYHSAIKNALRQAPDVVMIGEIRDTKAMEAALSLAETGHLCLATLHATNANQALERVIGFFPPEQHSQVYLQLSLALRAIVGQRMIKSVDGGRCVAVELLIDTPRVKDLIQKAQISELKEAMEKGAISGMQSFDQALFNLFKAGKISLEEALKNADSQNNLRLRVKLEHSAGPAPLALSGQ